VYCPINININVVWAVEREIRTIILLLSVGRRRKRKKRTNVYLLNKICLLVWLSRWDLQNHTIWWWLVKMWCWNVTVLWILFSCSFFRFILTVAFHCFLRSVGALGNVINLKPISITLFISLYWVRSIRSCSIITKICKCVCLANVIDFLKLCCNGWSLVLADQRIWQHVEHATWLAAG